jgi:hypothetical protein
LKDFKAFLLSFGDPESLRLGDRKIWEVSSSDTGGDDVRGEGKSI